MVPRFSVQSKDDYDDTAPLCKVPEVLLLTFSAKYFLDPLT